MVAGVQRGDARPSTSAYRLLPPEKRAALLRQSIERGLEQLIRLREGQFSFSLTEAIPAKCRRPATSPTRRCPEGINAQELLLDLARGMDEDRRDSTAALEASFAEPPAGGDAADGTRGAAPQPPAGRAAAARPRPGRGPGRPTRRGPGHRPPRRRRGRGPPHPGRALRPRRLQRRRGGGSGRRRQEGRPAGQGLDPVPARHRPRHADLGRDVVPGRVRGREAPLEDEPAPARAADGGDAQQHAAGARAADGDLAFRVQARPVQARPGAVRGRPARLRGQDRGRPPAAPRRRRSGARPRVAARRRPRPPRRRREGARRSASPAAARRRGRAGAGRPRRPPPRTRCRATSSSSRAGSRSCAGARTPPRSRPW